MPKPSISASIPPEPLIYTYGLRDVVYYHGAVGVSVVHGRQTLVSFLSCGIPNLEFYCRRLVEGYRLCEKGGADCGFAVIIELILE